MCQLAQATRCLVFGQKLFCISVRTSDEINIYIGPLCKVDCPPYCGWASPNPWKTCREQKSDPPLNKQFSCFDGLQTGTLALPGSATAWLPSDLNWKTSCADLGLASLHNHTSQCLKINFVYIYTCIQRSHIYMVIYYKYLYLLQGIFMYQKIYRK